jgi:hypothetical protein
MDHFIEELGEDDVSEVESRKNTRVTCPLSC